MLNPGQIEISRWVFMALKASDANVAVVITICFIASLGRHSVSLFSHAVIDRLPSVRPAQGAVILPRPGKVGLLIRVLDRLVVDVVGKAGQEQSIVVLLFVLLGAPLDRLVKILV